MCAAELETLARTRRNVRVVVFNDASLSLTASSRRGCRPIGMPSDTHPSTTPPRPGVRHPRRGRRGRGGAPGGVRATRAEPHRRQNRRVGLRRDPGFDPGPAYGCRPKRGHSWQRLARSADGMTPRPGTSWKPRFGCFAPCPECAAAERSRRSWRGARAYAHLTLQGGRGASRVVGHVRVVDPAEAVRGSRRSPSAWSRTTTAAARRPRGSRGPARPRIASGSRTSCAPGSRSKTAASSPGARLAGGSIGATRLALGGREVVIAAVSLPDIRPEPVVTETSVTFVQTSGGRTGLPAPRRVSARPFVQIAAPVAWTTLSLTISTGGVTHELAGASPFPRHWVYDASGQLASKSGLIDFTTWYRDAFGKRTPWGRRGDAGARVGGRDRLERDLSAAILAAGSSPVLRELAEGAALVTQGEAGEELFLLFDGLLEVEVDGVPVARSAPDRSWESERCSRPGGGSPRCAR